MIRDTDEEQFRRKLRAAFTPAQPVSDPEHLHGREQKLRTISRALSSAGKHIFIYGDRGVGKTSLAKTAAAIHSKSQDGFCFIACEQESSFFDLVEDAYRQLHKLYSMGKIKIESVELNALLAKFKVGESLTPPNLKNINDAIELFRIVAPPASKSPPPIIIIDEFDQLSSPREKKYIADLIKQLSDQNTNIRLCICGIGSSLDELIGVHLSTDRYVAPVALTPLSHDARWSILENAARTFELAMDRDSIIRIGQLSDGFPYYVHLMGEQIYWRAHDDPNLIGEISIHHYSEGIRAAVEESQTSLKQAYDLATQKHKNSKDYEEVLWSVADGGMLERQTSDIYENSYVPIISNISDRDALPKELFYQRLNKLKSPGHGQIVIGNRQGWYGFKENVLRGYVRLRAERSGVKIGVDHIKSKLLSN